MPQSKVYTAGPTQVAFNMTPMIDCTFQLIIFFILTTQIASSDYVRLKLPDPDNNIARKHELPQKVVVNVVPYSEEKIKADSTKLGLAMQYRVRTSSFDRGDIEQLVGQLIRAKREAAPAAGGKAAELVVELRSDRSVYYSEVEPVLRALQRAGLGTMYITAERMKHGD